MSIPKIIHQTYRSKKLPIEIKQNMKLLKELNPEWEYRFYDDEAMKNYIKKFFPEYYKYFQKINSKYGVVKADLFRYLLIYNEGGIYLDIKSSLNIPLDESLKSDDKMLLSYWNNWQGRFKGWGLHPEIDDPKGEYQQSFIVAIKGHPFLKAVIDKVIQNIDTYDMLKDGIGRLSVLRLSGPIAFTLGVKSVMDKQLFRLVDSENELGYIYSIYPEGEHKSLFPTHYSANTQPIVKQPFHKKIVYYYKHIFSKTK